MPSSSWVGFLRLLTLAFSLVLCSCRGPAPAKDTRAAPDEGKISTRLRPYLAALRNFSSPVSKARIVLASFRRDPATPSWDGAQEQEVSEMTRSYAPRIWWHPKEKAGPMDPITYVEHSSLWLRRRDGGDQRLAPKGKVDPSAIGWESTDSYAVSDRRVTPASIGPLTRPGDPEGLPSGEGFYLRYEGPTKLLEKSQDDSSISGPLFWRVGMMPREIPFVSSERVRVLIEYWYFSPFNEATGVGVGNHQGDWESLAAIIELAVDEGGKLQHWPKAFYLSAHEGGSWHCASDLNWVSSSASEGIRHPELFSALGTHATYAEEGDYGIFLIADRARKGHRWDAWQDLRPIAHQPYYGYSGAWGDIGIFLFMSGPLGPGPGFKPVPRGSVPAPQRVLQQCLS